MTSVHPLLAENARLQKRIEELASLVLQHRAIIEFYADDDTFRDGDVPRRYDPVTRDVHPDRGETARIALQELPRPTDTIEPPKTSRSDYERIAIIATDDKKQSIIAGSEVIGDIVETRQYSQITLDGISRRFYDDNDLHKFLSMKYGKPEICYPVDEAHSFAQNVFYYAKDVKKLPAFKAFDEAVGDTARQKGYPASAILADFKKSPDQFPDIQDKWLEVVRGDAENSPSPLLPTFTNIIDDWSRSWRMVRELAEIVPDAKPHLEAVLEEQMDYLRDASCFTSYDDAKKIVEVVAALKAVNTVGATATFALR